MLLLAPTIDDAVLLVTPLKGDAVCELATTMAGCMLASDTRHQGVCEHVLELSVSIRRVYYISSNRQITTACGTAQHDADKLCRRCASTRVFTAACRCVPSGCA
jgi:hypothetical protein